ncbi:MAG: lactoylglutathione lyase [Aestuariivirga sp.]|uniref:lactoylglutathione lyase n=1 Tax=Aestuariivirga sp. TaxID=2650926 RepID=UPI0038D253D2
MKAKMRMMHTMLRVLDLERSIAFYTGPLGMTLLRKLDFPEGRFSLAFVGYGEEPSNTVIELTHNWDQAAPYELGTAYGHIALETADIYETADTLRRAGITFTREPGPMKHGTTHIAFFRDPDNYLVELVQPEWMDARQ